MDCKHERLKCVNNEFFCIDCGKHLKWPTEDEIFQNGKKVTIPKIDLTLRQYEVMAQRTSRDELSASEHVMNGVLGLAGEAGECCDLVKKNRYQDGRKTRDDMLDELGDVLWYIVETARGMGLTLEEIALHNIEKLCRRYPAGFDPE